MALEIHRGSRGGWWRLLALSIAASALLLLAACGGDDDADGAVVPGNSTPPTTGTPVATATTVETETPPVSGESRSVFDLTLGDCFDPTEDVELGVVASDVRILPCTEPHGYEIYFAFNIGDTDTEFPGEQQIDQIWQDRCLEEFEPFVGTPYAESRLGAGALYPTPETWSRGDREVLCYLYDFFGEPLVGPMQGIAQ